MGLAERVDVAEKIHRLGSQCGGGRAEFGLALAAEFLAGDAAGDPAFTAGQAGDVKGAAARGEFAQQAGGEEFVVGVGDDDQHRSGFL